MVKKNVVPSFLELGNEANKKEVKSKKYVFKEFKDYIIWGERGSVKEWKDWFC